MMQRLRHITLLTFWIALATLTAQDDPSQPVASNTIYGELAGNAVALTSLNYERVVLDAWSARVGYGSTSLNVTHRLRTFVVMVQYNLPFSDGSVSVDLGIGPVFVTREAGYNNASDDPSLWAPGAKLTGLIGHRWQSPNGGFMSRIGFTPVFDFKRVYPMVGLNLGYAW